MSSESLCSSFRLGDAVDVVDYVANGSFATLKENVSYLDTPGHAILIRTADFNGDWNGNYVWVDEKAYRFLRKTALKIGDVILSNVGSVGVVFEAPNLGFPMTLGPNSVMLRSANDYLNQKFLYYYFLSPFGQDLLRSISTGSVQAKFNKTDLRNSQIFLPPREIQDAVADLLGALDDRITLLRETNATLEAIAQALFKSWFVDFDPVRARMEGRAPDGMDEATARLFPDSFEETELGGVPWGWRVGTVADLGEVICGKTPPTSNPKNYGDEVPFITIPDMHGLLVVTETARSLSRSGADSQKKKYLSPGAICVSCIATPGLVVKVTTESQTNQQINSVVPFDCWGKSFPLFLLRRIGDAVRAGGSGGSVFHNLSKSGFEELKVLFTSSDLAGRFNVLIDPLVLQVEENQHQAKTLSTLRDTLLPYLISGQLTIHF